MQHSEEAITNEDGFFRIKGLKPKFTYTIAPATHNRVQTIEFCIPASVDISLTKEDAKEVNFIFFGTYNTFGITGTVDVADEFVKYVEIEITSVQFDDGEHEENTIFKSTPLSISKFFEFSHLLV